MACRWRRLGTYFSLATTADRNILKINALLQVCAVHAIVTLAGCCIFSADDKLQQVTCAHVRLVITGHTAIRFNVLLLQQFL